MTDKEMIDCYKAQVNDLTEALEERIQRIKELEAEVERLDHCVKTEDEVRAIMKTQMSSVVREVTAEQFDTAMEIAKTAAIREFAAAAKDRIVSDFLTATGGENTAQSLAVLKVLDVLEGLKNEMTEDTDNGAE